MWIINEGKNIILETLFLTLIIDANPFGIN